MLYLSYMISILGKPQQIAIALFRKMWKSNPLQIIFQRFRCQIITIFLVAKTKTAHCKGKLLLNHANGYLGARIHFFNSYNNPIVSIYSDLPFYWSGDLQVQIFSLLFHACRKKHVMGWHARTTLLLSTRRYLKTAFCRPPTINWMDG